jgi:hypothetical protein
MKIWQLLEELKQFYKDMDVFLHLINYDELKNEDTSEDERIEDIDQVEFSIVRESDYIALKADE